MIKPILVIVIMVLSLGLFSCQSKTGHENGPSSSQQPNQQPEPANPPSGDPSTGEPGGGPGGGEDSKGCGRYCVNSAEARVLFQSIVENISGEWEEFEIDERMILAGRALSLALHETKGVWLDDLTKGERRYLIEMFFDEKFFLKNPEKS